MARTGGTAVVNRRQHFLRAECIGSGEGLFSRRAPFQCTAAHAIIARACLPHAAPSDVGAVHHDMSPRCARH